MQTKTRRPRVTEFERTDLYFSGRYKQHEIRIDRDSHFHNWYIVVRDQRGCYVYDGWWPDSDCKSLNDAILEACQGAMLFPAHPATQQEEG